MKSRDYQQAAEDAVFKSWEAGNKSVVGRMFTGGGKTVVFASVIRRLKKRAMVLAHRKELIWQARDKIKAVTNLEVDIEMGEYKASTGGDLFRPSADVIVSSIQTHTAGGDGRGRMTKFNPEDFGLLIIDECHHAVSPSYRKVIDYYMSNKELLVLGVTATPDRGDEKALGLVFNDAPEGFDYDMSYGIKNGWVVPIMQQVVAIESLDFSSIHTTAGDLNQGELASVMEEEKPLYGIADSTIQIIGNKRGIGFSPSVNHARLMANIFNRYRPGMAAFVHGKTDPEERAKINSAFKNGEIQAIWNCGTHTEGFDDSGVEWVVPKPTKVRQLYEQMIGRGGRLHESIAKSVGSYSMAGMRRGLIARSVKPSCLVIDHYGNSGKHKLVTTAHILSGDFSEEAIEESVLIARKTGMPIRVDKTLEEEEKRIEEKKKRDSEEAARKAGLKGNAKFKLSTVDPFDLLDLKPVKERSWDSGKKPTENMRRFLKDKMGLDPDKFTFSQAGQLIGEQKRRWDAGLCSAKQAKRLRQYGYPTDMKFEDAKKVMDALAKNNWKKLATSPIIPKRKNPSSDNQPIIDGEIPF